MQANANCAVACGICSPEFLPLPKAKYTTAMSPTLSHDQLVLRALDRVSPEERKGIDAQLAADPVARQRYEQIAQHFVLYDSLPEAPEAPAFSKVLARLETQPEARPARRDRPRETVLDRSGQLLMLGAVAAVLLVGVLFWPGSERRDPPPDTAPVIISGDWHMAVAQGIRIRWPDGTESLGTGLLEKGSLEQEAPDPQTGVFRVLSSDTVLTAERQPARVDLGQVAVVLDRASPLQLKTQGVLRLEAGRAHFDVQPGPLQIETPYGDVEVVGTEFEIDLRHGGLAVRVAEGVVRVGEQRIEAGQSLDGGRVSKLQGVVGEWFRDPLLLLTRGAGDLSPGAPLRFDLTFANPALVELRGPGPEGWLTALSAEIWEAGSPRERLPLSLHEENLVRGQDLLEPGRPLVLRPGERRTLGLQLRSPFPRPGNWRLRVWYRPAEGRAQVPSDVLELEVR